MLVHKYSLVFMFHNRLGINSVVIVLPLIQEVWAQIIFCEYDLKI